MLVMISVQCSQRSPSQQRFPWTLQLKEQILKEQITDDRVFFKMPFCPFSFLLRMMDTIVVFSVWASYTLKMHSWMTHAPVVGSPFLSERIDTFWRHPCWSLWLEQRITGWRSGRSKCDTFRASPPGTSPRTSYSSHSEHPVRFLGDFTGPSHGASQHLIRCAIRG